MDMFEIVLFLGICAGTRFHIKQKRTITQNPEQHLNILLKERQLWKEPKGLKLKKVGNLIEIHLKIGLRTGKIYYNPTTKITRYSPYLRYHSLMNEMGVIEMNRWVRAIAKTYRPSQQKRETSAFHKQAWLHLIEVAQAFPLLSEYEKNDTSEKKTFSWGTFSLKLVRLKNGVIHIAIKENNMLQLEGEYHEKDKRVYVTSRSMLKAPYYWLQVELIEFLETFCGNEVNQHHDYIRYKHIEKEVIRLLQLSKYKEKHEQIKSLWKQFSKAKSYDPHDYQLMVHSLTYLSRKSNQHINKEFLHVKERYDEN